MHIEKYNIQFKEEECKYTQLAQKIKTMINKGDIQNGEKLPPIRTLSRHLNVNNVTVVNAYKSLETEGYAVMKMGSGTYAKSRHNAELFKRDYAYTFRKINDRDQDNIIDFAGETSSSSYFPIEDFKKVVSDVLDRDGAKALTYQERLGYEGLRKTISYDFWNGKVDYNKILILSGAQQGIDIASKVLVNINDDVIIEKPSYGGAISVFKARGANIYSAPMMKDGIDIDAFEKILSKNNIKVFYTMSYFQNPTGATYSLEKKKRILELARIYDFYIIEDDYLSELIFDEDIVYESFKSLDVHDRVIYLKSFSKIFLPGIRLGYMIVPKRFKESIQSTKINTDISTSGLMQRVLAMYIEKGLWKNHINILSTEYKKRYDYMLKCIEEKLNHKGSFFVPGGGINFFINMNDKVSIKSTDLFYEARKKGVIITPGVIFYENFDEGLRSFRIGYSQTDKDKIEQGIEILSKIMEESYDI